MHERQSQIPSSRLGKLNSSAGPSNLLSHPAAQGKVNDINQIIPRLPQLAYVPQNAKAEARLLGKYARRRNRAIWAQALVLFNVVGIPLSQGVYLEYYHTITLSTSGLSALSLIPALQVLCILSMPMLVGWVYHWRGSRSGWRITFFVATLLASCAQLPLQWYKSYILTMILQGPLQGVALGTLFTLSTLVLSSHYKFNLPLVSMSSGFMGFCGAVVYTVVARQGLGMGGSSEFAPAATTGISVGTLFTAYVLIRRVKEDDLPTNTKLVQAEVDLSKAFSGITREQGTIWFILGYVLVFFGLFIFPIYIVATLAQPPALVSPDLGVWALVTTLASAAMSACISSNSAFRRRLGPVDTFSAASVFAGAASVVPAWMPSFVVVLACGTAYGIGLGAMVALHIKATTVFHREKVAWHPDMAARTAIIMALGGGSAFAGLLVSAVAMEKMQDGVKLVQSVAAGCLFFGGVLIALGRYRRCAKFYMAI
jgi:hypothetical protein